LLITTGILSRRFIVLSSDKSTNEANKSNIMLDYPIVK
jgi:hypothetical protein